MTLRGAMRSTRYTRKRAAAATRPRSHQDHLMIVLGLSHSAKAQLVVSVWTSVAAESAHRQIWTRRSKMLMLANKLVS